MSSEDWYVIDPQPTINGGYEYDEWNDWVGDSFDEALTETQLGETVYFCKGQYNGETGLFETEFETRAVVDNKTFDTYTQGWKRQILTKIGDLVANYKYIKIKDTLDNWQIYIIMAMPDSNGIYTKVVAHECNYTLKWQDGETGIVYYYPSHTVDATQYNTGVETAFNIIQTGYIQLMSWISLDDITAELQRDKRMFIDFSKKHPDTYIITSMSKVPYSYNESRIMRITFTEHEFNPQTDRIDLMLCDYIDPSSIPQPTSPIEILYSGNPEIRIGRTKTFRVDTNENIGFDLLVLEQWRDKIHLINIDNHSCKVKVDSDVDMVGSNFKLVANNGVETSKLIISVKGGI